MITLASQPAIKPRTIQAKIAMSIRPPLGEAKANAVPDVAVSDQLSAVRVA
jgi:hypothetical protein